MFRDLRLIASIVCAVLVTMVETPAHAQTRVLIDASADGGVWWSPQTGSYDPGLPHQGKPLADLLRGQGHSVTELAPGSQVTCDQLSTSELVIVIDGQVRRTPQVVRGYAGYASNGGRLILMNDHHASLDADSISLALGLDFAGSVAGTITTFTAHPITAGVTSLNYLTGSVVTRLPTSATVLGSIGGQPAMGVMPFGHGRVFFIGDTNGLEGVPQPLTNNLFAFMLNGATAVPACRVDTAVDFGPAYGTWKLSPTGLWSPIHPLSPETMRTADFDGNGFDDIAFDFGPGVGLYLWMNHSTWVFLHPLSPTQMVAGDLNDDGRSDLIGVFAGHGLWRWADGGWTQLHPLEPVRLAVGDIDSSTGRDDLVADFPGFGVFTLYNNLTWSALHPLNTSALMVADLDGLGSDEVVVSFAGFGLFVYRNNTGWQHLHGIAPARLSSGHVDAHPGEDVVVDFGSGVGLWSLRNLATWVPIHPFTSEGMVLLDRDGTGRDEILVDFGASYGLWQYANDSDWSHVHPFSPEGLVGGILH